MVKVRRRGETQEYGTVSEATAPAEAASGIDPTVLTRLKRKCPSEDVEKLLMVAPLAIQQEKGISTSSNELAKALDKAIPEQLVRMLKCDDTLVLIGTLMQQGMTAEDTATGVLQMWGLLLAPTPESTSQLSQTPVPKHGAEQVWRGSIAFLDAQNGFRTLAFGTPLSSCEGLVLHDDGGDTKWYVRTNDDLTVGKAKLDAIYYAFYKDTLFEIGLFTRGAVNCRALLDYVQATYGKGRPDPQKNVYGWVGKLVHAYYEQVRGTEDAKFHMWSEYHKPPKNRPTQAPAYGPPRTPTPLSIEGLLPDALFSMTDSGVREVMKDDRRPTPPRAQHRRAAYLEVHPELPEDIRQAISAGKPAVGMTTQETLACCGPPIDEARSESSEGHVERWQYGEPGFAYGFMLYSKKLDPTDLHDFCFFTFVNDRLVGWECQR
jgi:hypothetical protein